MELTKEQIQEFKQQIIQQIENSFSEDKKGPAIEQINYMGEEEFIEFLKKNKLLTSESDNEDLNENKIPNKKENPFRLIVEKKINSYLIDENKYSIAVLEIKPISKAHTIIIPKEAISKSGKLPQSAFSMAKRISKKIETKFKPKEILISSSYILGETIINILPIYSNESLNSPRKQTSEEELENLKKILERKQKKKQLKKVKIKKIEESKMWLPRRIP